MQESFRDRDAEALLPRGEPEREVVVSLRLFANGQIEADLTAAGDEAWLETCLARSAEAERALAAALGVEAEHVAVVSLDKGRKA